MIIKLLLMIIRDKVACFKCKRDIDTKAWYCCNPLKKYCVLCIDQKCQCGRLPIKIYQHKPAKQLKKKECCFCKSNQDKENHQYFFQEKCKLYYCHSCLLRFYDRYFDMVEKLKAQSGENPQILVELPCQCEVDKKKIVQYVKMYCLYCSKKLEGETILLKNQCSIMFQCFQKLQSYLKQYPYRSKQIGVSKLLDRIQTLFIKCESCKEVIEGQLVKIDELYFCHRCFQTSKMAETVLSKKIDEKESESKKEKELQKKNEKGKQKTGLRLSKDYQKQPKIEQKCQKCNRSTKLFKLQDGSKTCYQCYQVPKKHSSENIISNKEQAKGLKQLQDNKNKINQQKSIKSISKVQKIEVKSQIRKQEKSSNAKQSNIKQKSIKQFKQRLNLLIIEQQASQLNQKSQLKISKINSSIDDEFLEVEKIELWYKQKQQKMIECSKCRIFSIEQTTFKAYEREPSNTKTIRIAQAQQIKRQKMIKVFCKICYIELKNKIKRQQQLRKNQAGRYSYSVSKKEQKKDIKSPITLNKGGIYSYDYQYQPLSKKQADKNSNNLQKRFNNLMKAGGNDQIRIGQRKKQETTYEFYDKCLSCKKTFYKSQLSIMQKLCKICQMEKRSKQQDKSIPIKICTLCNKNQLKKNQFVICSQCFGRR